MPAKTNSLPFIPAWFDDAALDPFAFRIFAHIFRRDGGDGCYEGVIKMAKHCKMGEHKVRSSLRALISKGLVDCQNRPGQPALYRVGTPYRYVKGETDTPYGLVRPPLTYQSGDPLHISKTKVLQEGTPIKENTPEAFKEDSWELRTAVSFAEGLATRGTLDADVERADTSGRKRQMQKWASEFDKLCRIDRHSTETIEKVLTWLLTEDEFWIKNGAFRTAMKLRSKKRDTGEMYFDILLIQMRKGAEKDRGIDRRPPNEFEDQLSEIREHQAAGAAA